MADLAELKQSYRSAGERYSQILDDARARARTKEEFDECDGLYAEMNDLLDQMKEAGMSDGDIEAFKKAELRGDSDAASGGTTASAGGAVVESMKRTMASMGLTPKADPGAGLPLAQANMARHLASKGIAPRLPGR